MGGWRRLDPTTCDGLTHVIYTMQEQIGTLDVEKNRPPAVYLYALAALYEAYKNRLEFERP